MGRSLTRRRTHAAKKVIPTPDGSAKRVLHRLPENDVVVPEGDALFGDGAGSEYDAPVDEKKVSAKTLGKRKVVEEEDEDGEDGDYEPAVAGTRKRPSPKALGKRKVEEDSDSDSELEVPATKKAKVSDKALGKRKAVEVDDAFAIDTKTQYQKAYRSKARQEAHLWNDKWWNNLGFIKELDNAVLDQGGPPNMRSFNKQKIPIGDLTSDVHPMLWRQNWLLDGFVEEPEKLWSNLQPALRMASKFLTVPESQMAWHPLVFGKLTQYKDTAMEILEHDDTPWSLEQFQDADKQVQKNFADLTHNVKFSFAAFGRLDHEKDEEEAEDGEDHSDHAQVHGLHFAPGDPYHSELFVTGDLEDLKTHQNKHRIFFNIALAKYLSQDYPAMDRVQLVRTLFVMGVAILHELSHAMYNHTRKLELKIKDGYKYAEPLIFDDEKAEIGAAFERMLFGTDTNVVVHPDDGAFLEACKFPAAYDGGELVYARPHHRCFIEPKWMYAFFLEATWSRIASLAVKQSLHTACRWPRFRYVTKTKRPDVEDWYNGKKDRVLKRVADMVDFHNLAAEDNWEIIMGGGNGKKGSVWSAAALDDQFTMLQKLEKDYLEWGVEHAREERNRKVRAAKAESPKLAKPVPVKKARVAKPVKKPAARIYA